MVCIHEGFDRANLFYSIGPLFNVDEVNQQKYI